MRDTPRAQLADIVALLRGRTVTTRELKGVLRELGEIAARSPALAEEAKAEAAAVRKRIHAAGS